MRKTIPLLAALAVSVPTLAAADAMTATDRAKARAFDASGKIACAQEVGQEMGTCKADVARAGTSAAVVVTFPNGFARTLIFEDGAFLRGNSTMSGVGTDTDWRLADGIHSVRVDDQRYELPQTLVFGE